MVDGLKMIHDSWIQDALHHESHERGAANNEIQFHIWTFINSEKWKRCAKLSLNFFPLTCSRFSFTWAKYRVGVRSVRLPFVKRSGKTENCWHHIVYGMMRIENTLRMLCVSRIIAIRPYSGLFTLAHQRKMLTLCSWGRKIFPSHCLQILLMAQDSDSVYTQIGIRTVHIGLCSSILVYRMYRFVFYLTLNLLNIEHQLCYFVNWKRN